MANTAKTTLSAITAEKKPFVLKLSGNIDTVYLQMYDAGYDYMYDFMKAYNQAPNSKEILAHIKVRLSPEIKRYMKTNDVYSSEFFLSELVSCVYGFVHIFVVRKLQGHSVLRPEHRALVNFINEIVVLKYMYVSSQQYERSADVRDIHSHIYSAIQYSLLGSKDFSHEEWLKKTSSKNLEILASLGERLASDELQRRKVEILCKSEVKGKYKIEDFSHWFSIVNQKYFISFLKDLIAEHDEEYVESFASLGVQEMPNEMLTEVFTYAEKSGKEMPLRINEFNGSCYRLHGYDFQTTHGQGTKRLLYSPKGEVLLSLG